MLSIPYTNRTGQPGRDMAPHLKQHGALELRRSGAFSNSKLGKTPAKSQLLRGRGAIAQAATSLGAKQKWRLLAPPPSLRSPSFPPLPVHPADSGTITATAANLYLSDSIRVGD